MKSPLFLLLVALLFAVSCDGEFASVTVTQDGEPPVIGSGVRVTETRDVTGFSAVHMKGAFSVSATCGADHAFSMTGDDNLLPMVETKVEDGTLTISLSGSIKTEKTIRIELSAPTLNRVTVGGAVRAHLTGLSGDSFDLQLSGAGSVTAAGSVRSLDINASGAMNLNAEELRAQVVSVEMSGAGNGTVTATEELHVTISGVGRLECHGNPPKVSKSLSGLGKLTLK